MRVNTSNGLERQNRALKYDYLAAYRDTSLSGLVTLLLERFHPDAYRRSVFVIVVINVFLKRARMFWFTCLTRQMLDSLCECKTLLNAFILFCLLYRINTS